MRRAGVLHHFRRNPRCDKIQSECALVKTQALANWDYDGYISPCRICKPRTLAGSFSKDPSVADWG